MAFAPFSSLRDVVKGYLRLRFAEAFLDRTVDLAGLRGGFDPARTSTVDAISRSKATLALIDGRRDERISHAHSERIFRARPAATKLGLVDCANHKGVLTHAETGFPSRVPAWLDRKLARYRFSRDHDRVALRPAHAHPAEAVAPRIRKRSLDDRIDRLSSKTNREPIMSFAFPEWMRPRMHLRTRSARLERGNEPVLPTAHRFEGSP